MELIEGAGKRGADMVGVGIVRAESSEEAQTSPEVSA